MGTSKKAGEGLTLRTCSDRTRQNDLELKEGRFRSGTGQKCVALTKL